MRFSIEQTYRFDALQEKEQLYEKLISQLYRSILKLGDAAVDGGAHGGMHTLPMAECVGRTGKVYAFEPVPSLVTWLENQSVNIPQIVVSQKALGSEERTATLHLFPDEPWYSSLHDRKIPGERRAEKIVVDVVTLDHLVPESVRFIKLDLEGGEYHAIQGGKRLVQQQSPIIAMECGRATAARFGGYSSDDYFALFASMRYELVDILGQPFGPEEFLREWDDRTVPGYVVAYPVERIDVVTALYGRALDSLR